MRKYSKASLTCKSSTFVSLTSPLGLFSNFVEHNNSPSTRKLLINDILTLDLESFGKRVEPGIKEQNRLIKLQKVKNDL